MKSRRAFLGLLTAAPVAAVSATMGAQPVAPSARSGVARARILWGEGRTPEAYVPLPDGRRIPVNGEWRTLASFKDLSAAVRMRPSREAVSDLMTKLRSLHA